MTLLPAASSLAGAALALLLLLSCQQLSCGSKVGEAIDDHLKDAFIGWEGET
jgi:hypothetical protein